MDHYTKVRVSLEGVYLAMLAGFLRVVTIQGEPLLDIIFAAWGL